MGIRLGDRPGEIQACVELIDAHPEECRYSLLRVGLSLDDLETGQLSWADCWSVLKVETDTRGSPLDRARTGDDSMWSAELHMLAHLGDLLAVANWQRSGSDGDQPNRIPRPGLSESGDEKRITGEPMTIEELDAELARRRQAHQSPDD